MRNLINKKKFLFSLYIIFVLVFILQLPAYAQFTISLGYSFINTYSTINTNFLPCFGLSYFLATKSINLSFNNNFYFSLDNFFVDNLSFNFLYKNNNNYFSYQLVYSPFNLLLVNDKYYPGNFIFTRFDYQSYKKNKFDLSIEAEYDQLTTNLIDSPLNFNLNTSFSIPFAKNIFTNSLNIFYDTEDTFNYSLLEAILTSKIIFYPTINEMIIPKISILGGYSYNDTSGNFIGFSISNIFYSAISSIVAFSSELLLEYRKFLTSVLTDDVDYSEIKENIMFTIKYSNFINSSHQFDIRLLYFPQESTASNLNRAIFEIKNTIFYSSSNLFIIDFLSLLRYEYWFLQSGSNSLELFFELILKFIPSKMLSLLLLNDLSTSFSSTYDLWEIYAQIKFMFIYYFTQNFSFQGLITYKGLNDKLNDTFYQYFIINLSFSYTF